VLITLVVKVLYYISWRNLG